MRLAATVSRSRQSAESCPPRRQGLRMMSSFVAPGPALLVVRRCMHDALAANPLVMTSGGERRTPCLLWLLLVVQTRVVAVDEEPERTIPCRYCNPCRNANEESRVYRVASGKPKLRSPYLLRTRMHVDDYAHKNLSISGLLAATATDKCSRHFFIFFL